MKSVTVLGATSLIGHFLLPALVHRGYCVTGISRSPQSPVKGVTWRQHDISATPLDVTDDTLISLAPIWALSAMLQRVDRLPRRIIAFSSTSIISKADSSAPEERRLVENLANGESLLQSIAGHHRIGWTILRPTMVYGAGKDRNVSTIAHFIDRFGFFPLLGAATGKRSPVHADDLAKAVLKCMDGTETQGRCYSLTGGEAIRYEVMVERIFKALGRRKRILRIPRKPAHLAINLASRLPRYSHLTPTMVDRTAKDLLFDDYPARRDFGYQPRPFEPQRTDLIAPD